MGPRFRGDDSSRIAHNTTGQKPWREFSISPSPRRRAAVCSAVNDNAMLGYLAGPRPGGNLGQSIGHGLAGWLTGQRLDRQRLVSAQTYRALADAGVPDAMAKAAALNPQIMKAVAGAYFGREPFEDVASVNTVVHRLGDLMTAADRSAG